MTTIKCPHCDGAGYKYLFESRYYFQCVECGLNCLLRFLQTYIKNKSRWEDERS